MPVYRATLPAIATATAFLLGNPTAAQADIVLSQVIVDLPPGRPPRDDIEVWNSGSERSYVIVEPAEIKSAGKPDERRVISKDPTALGLLVTPQRLVLEPDQRRLVRVSAISPRQAVDRVYRVAIKPVAGPLNSSTTALKVLIGYDVLVIYRPDKFTGEVTGGRTDRNLLIRNGGNTAQELFDGKQCNATGTACFNLAATRLYPGASLEQKLPYDTVVKYKISNGSGVVLKQF